MLESHWFKSKHSQGYVSMREGLQGAPFSVETFWVCLVCSTIRQKPSYIIMCALCPHNAEVTIFAY